MTPAAEGNPVMSQERFIVEHAPEARKYLLVDREAADGPTAIGEEAYVDVDDTGARERVLFHTGVSDEYAEQGLASVLVRGAVEQAIADGCAVVPVCPYVAAWLPKHPEYAAHVVQPAGRHLRALRTRE